MLNQELLKSLIYYNPETGVATWLPRKETTKQIAAWNRRYAGKALSYVDKKGAGYAQVCMVIDGVQKYYLLHRLIWLYVFGEFPNGPIDHVNRIKSDNRISNLRVANRVLNGHNVKSYNTNKSGIKGVSWSKESRKWRAVLVFNQKYMHLGLFDSIEDAKDAYIVASLSHANEFSIYSVATKGLN